MANTTFSGPVISKNGFITTGPGITKTINSTGLGAADKNINLGTTTTAANANATSIASALSANGFNSAIVDDVDGATFLTPLTANSTVYGAGAGSSTTSSTTKVMIYYTISDNGKPSESEPVLS